MPGKRQTDRINLSKGSKHAPRPPIIEREDLEKFALSLIPFVVSFIPFILPFGWNALVLARYPWTGFLLGIVAIIILYRTIGINNSIGAFFLLIVSGLFLPNISYLPSKANEAETKSNCNQITLALEKYSEDHDWLYPSEINVLIEDGYLDKFPDNPFSEEEMISVKLGSEDFEGNFTYVPVYKGEIVIGYYLMGYGHQENYGIDVDNDGTRDHVITVRYSTEEYYEYDSEGNRILIGRPVDEKPEIPPLEELLRVHVQDAHDTD